MAGTGKDLDTYERNRGMEAAFDVGEMAPPLRASDAPMITIDDRPRGAQKVDVYRDEKRIFPKLKTLAAAGGDDFYYRWPVKNKDGSTDWVEGPSVKCTNAVARTYGNCTLKGRAEDKGDHWIINAQFVDLETGYTYERPFQQRKGQNIGGKMDKDRATDLVFQIGVSKALRNAVTNSLPEFVGYAWTEAKQQIVEKVGKNMPRYRELILERLKALEVGVDRVEAMRGRKFPELLAPDLAAIIAEIQTVNDGMADPLEMWPIQAATREALQPKRSDYTGPGGGADRGTQSGTNGKPADDNKQPATPDDLDDLLGMAKQALAKANDVESIDSVDANMVNILRRHKRLDAIEAWDKLIASRREALAAGDAKPADGQTVDPGQGAFEDWYRDQVKQLGRCATLAEVDSLQDVVAAELTDGDDIAAWKLECDDRVAELRRGR